MTHTAAQGAPHSRLEHYPVTFFASVMGIAGLSLALHAAENALGWGGMASDAAFVVASLLFVSSLSAMRSRPCGTPAPLPPNGITRCACRFFPRSRSRFCCLRHVRSPGTRQWRICYGCREWCCRGC